MKLKSNEPFWLVKNGMPHSFPSLRSDIQVDVLIIGAGITGSLIAHKCIQLGYETAIVDKREVCNGSTAATTSMLQYELDKPLIELIKDIGEEAAVATYRACSDGIDTIEDLVKTIKSDCGFQKADSLYYAAWKKDIESLEREFQTRRKFGFPVKWISANEINNRFKIENTYGGILSKKAASFDAFRFTYDLLAYNAAKGLKVFDKTNVSKVNYKNNGITAKSEHGFTIKATKIIYCNGYESAELIKDDFVNLQSTYAIISEQINQASIPFANTLVWNTANPYMYMRVTDDKRILIGGEDEDFANAQKRDELIEKKAEKIILQAKKILPHMEFYLDFAWAGTFGVTKDSLPYIGKHPDFPSAYFVLGFGGNGITFSAAGMDMVAAMLDNKEHPLTPYFRFRR